MKKILIFLTLSLFTSYMFALEHGDSHAVSKKAITKFLVKNCPYSDPNPTRQDDADEINNFLIKVLEKKYKPQDDEELRSKALLLLFKNSVSEFEDTVDVQRMGHRRALCFIILSLLSDETQFGIFLNDAEYSLKSSGIYDSEQAAINNLLHILRMFDNENMSVEKLKYQIESYKDQFVKMKGNIQSKKFVSGYDALLKQVTEK